MGKREREKHKDQIINMFTLKNINLSNIAISLSINRLDVKKVLMEENLYSETKKFIEKDTEAQKRIIELYKKGKTIKEIIKLVGYSEHPVKNILYQNNIKRRNAGHYNRKYTVNHRSFSEHNPESVYWAGFIAGDGCVYNHGIANKEINNYLSIGLASCDMGHLEKFKEFTQYSGKLYVNEASVAITINSKKIVSDLEKKYNITNNKTDTYIPPSTIPTHLLKYFILGLFDSDGSISKTRRPNKNHNHVNGNYVFQINFTGTKETCEFIKGFFSSNVKLHKRHDNESNNYTIVIQGNKQLIKYFNMLYDEETERFCLQRKFKIFSQLIKQYGNKSLMMETL